MSKIEEIAAAIDAAGHAWLDAQDPNRERMGWADVPSEIFARASLEAMREPSESMTAHPSYIAGEWSRRTLEASIAAALGEHR